MKKIELLKMLAEYDDDQEIFVEARDGGFEEPLVYVSALRARKAHEFINGTTSEYMNNRGATGIGAVVLGTAEGFTYMA